MIPKIIHYCWFGGNPLPKSAIKCINSWKKFFPDYEIKEWNESNFDVNAHVYTKYCSGTKKWAYLSDYVRLVIVERYGGIYFDTDVEVVRYPSELIKVCTAWFGFESDNYINTGLGFAAEAHHPAIVAMRNEYEELWQGLTREEEMAKAIVGCPYLNTKALTTHGMQLGGKRQNVLEAEILPVDFLCPYNDLTGVMSKTENTVSIHWFSKSPHGRLAWWRSKITRPLHRIFGVNAMSKINKVIGR